MREFNRAKLLKNDELIKQIIFYLDEARSRMEANRHLLERLCSFSSPTQIWYSLQASGPQRFNELMKLGLSSRTLSKSLRKLMGVELVDHVDNKYRALIPEWYQKEDLQV